MGDEGRAGLGVVAMVVGDERWLLGWVLARLVPTSSLPLVCPCGRCHLVVLNPSPSGVGDIDLSSRSSWMGVRGVLTPDPTNYDESESDTRAIDEVPSPDNWRRRANQLLKKKVLTISNCLQTKRSSWAMGSRPMIGLEIVSTDDSIVSAPY